MIQAQVRSRRPVSTKAEKFSTLPWPYWWSASAGLSETPTEKNVSNEAIRSSAECAASERMPRLPVVRPTAAFRPVITTAASTEFPAAARFSARIKSEGEMAGVPDMLELSLLEGKSAKRIGTGQDFELRSTNRRSGCPHLCVSTVTSHQTPDIGQTTRDMLGFNAWHLHLSGEPIL